MQLCTRPKSNDGWSVTESKKQGIKEHFEWSDVVTFVRQHHGDIWHYMRSAMAPAYKLYVEEQKVLGASCILSLSTIMHYLPKRVKCMWKVLYQHCLCDVCLNFSLLIDAMCAAGYTSFACHITEVLLASLCQHDGHDSSIGDCHYDSIFRQCNLCSVDMLCATLSQSTSTSTWTRRFLGISGL